MNSLFSVMIGGAIGSGARYVVGQTMLARLGPNFPWWTLSVNIAGSFLMGLLVGWLAREASGGEATRLFVGVATDYVDWRWPMACLGLFSLAAAALMAACLDATTPEGEAEAETAKTEGEGA